VLLNSGDDVTLNYIIKYLYTFSCSVELLSFPFDVQFCTLNISLREVPGTSCKPQFEINNTLKSDEQTTSLYFVDKLRYHVDNTQSSNNSYINIFVLLRRRFQSYILTQFLPCFFLLILGNFTLLCFRIDDFADKITITLSLLIVVASLFSQTVSSLPVSPEPKCIEIFFFMIILRLAYIFIIHTFVDVVITRANDPKAIPENSKNTKITSKVEPQATKAWEARFDTVKIDQDTQRIIPKYAHTINTFGLVSGLVIDLICLIALVWVVVADRNEHERKIEQYSF